MGKNEMNESAQIRERFLANTRAHFLIDGATIGETHPAEQKGGKSRNCGTSEQQRRQSGC